jgi:hypothetical protein
MKEFWIGVLVGLVLAVIGDLFAMPHRANHTELLRDCSITGAHIIADDTVIVCRVVKVDQTQAPTIPKEKPEVTL